MHIWSHGLLLAPLLPCLSNANGNPEEKAKLDGTPRRERPHYGLLNQASEETNVNAKRLQGGGESTLVLLIVFAKDFGRGFEG